MDRKKILIFTWSLFLCNLEVVFSSEELSDCPLSCPNVYKPICSGGVTYDNMCFLKLEVCKGNIKSEAVEEIEPCPEFNDISGSSSDSVKTADEKVENEGKRNKKNHSHNHKQQMRRRFCASPCPERTSDENTIKLFGNGYENNCTAIKEVACATELRRNNNENNGTESSDSERSPRDMKLAKKEKLISRPIQENITLDEERI
ncbi:uncharacterized protein LOC124406327 [Diprion similis]|uniref:uncharacterized protein LOC124406327 n=1 Tax=Diprion similis TaxID=362088 RepID=UPI001EF7E2B1|nr:uncharacterized protein LOC124406327 [Diprion similis]